MTVKVYDKIVKCELCNHEGWGLSSETLCFNCGRLVYLIGKNINLAKKIIKDKEMEMKVICSKVSDKCHNIINCDHSKPHEKNAHCRANLCYHMDFNNCACIPIEKINNTGVIKMNNKIFRFKAKIDFITDHNVLIVAGDPIFVTDISINEIKIFNLKRENKGSIRPENSDDFFTAANINDFTEF